MIAATIHVIVVVAVDPKWTAASMCSARLLRSAVEELVGVLIAKRGADI